MSLASYVTLGNIITLSGIRVINNTYYIDLDAVGYYELELDYVGYYELELDYVGYYDG